MTAIHIITKGFMWDVSGRLISSIHLPEFNGTDVAVTGGSQGGALTIVTAGLDNRIKYMAALYPALCDHTGYLNKRAGGWPHYFRNAEPKPGEVETLGLL